MRTRRFRGKQDSLDLLLDTICNTFGGIIFIACLVALLARDANSVPDRAMEQADLDMIKRRIDVATSDLEKLEGLITRQTEKRASTSTLVTRRDELTEAIKEMRAKSASAREQSSGTPPSGELQKLRAANRLLRNEVERLLNAVTSSEKEIARLETRQKDLEAKAFAAKAKTKEQLRFPKERKQDKSVLFVILKHGKIYSCWEDSGERNNTTISWEPVGDDDADDAVRATPIPSQGGRLPAEAGDVSAQLRAIASSEKYIAIALFPDSYDTWRDYRGIVQDVGLEYGLLFRTDMDDNVAFVSKGSKPPSL